MQPSTDATHASLKAMRRTETFSRLVLAIGVGIALSTVGLVILVQRPLPLGDQWDNVVSGRAVTWAWLTSQHNEHRLLLPRLVFLADRAWDREGNVVDLAANLVIQAGTTLLMIRLARGVGLASGVEARWSVGLVLAFLFSAVQCENLTWGFQVQFLGIGLIAVATFATLVLAPPTVACLIAVVVLEAMGIYTLAAGIVIAGLTVPLCMWLRRPLSHAALLAAAAAGLIGLYLTGYRRPEAHADPVAALFHLDRIAVYVLTELGNPLWALQSLQSPLPATIAGLLGLLLFVLFGCMVVRDRDRQDGLVLFAIASFVVATTVLTGLGRWTFGTEQALSGRYASPALLFWLAQILFFAATLLRRFGAGSRTWVIGAGLLIAVLLAVKQPRFILGSVLADLDRQAAVPTVLAGVDDPDMLQRLLAPRDGVFAARARLKDAHGSVFVVPEADWLDHRLPGAASDLAVPACAGRYTVAERLESTDHPGWRASGVLDQPAVSGLSNRMILVDDTGRVVGFGRSGLMARAATADPPGSPSRSGLWLREVMRGERPDRWIGAFEDVDPASVKAYVLTRNGAPACSLGPAGTVSPHADE